MPNPIRRRSYALLSDPERRARFDKHGVAEGEADMQPEFGELQEWRDVKVPFTALRDRSFYSHAEQVAPPAPSVRSRCDLGVISVRSR